MSDLEHKDSSGAGNWAGVVQAQMLAEVALTAADPSRPIGAAQKSAVTAGSVRSAMEAFAEGSLLAEIGAA